MNKRLLCSLQWSFAASNLSCFRAVSVWKRADFIVASAATRSIGIKAGKSGNEYARCAFLIGSPKIFRRNCTWVESKLLTSGPVLLQTGDDRKDDNRFSTHKVGCYYYQSVLNNWLLIFLLFFFGGVLFSIHNNLLRLLEFWVILS